MNIISIGTDRNVFKSESSVLKRVVLYGSELENLHIIVFALKKLKLKDIKISSNVFAYSTNSFSRFLYFIDAFFLGWKIIRNNGLNKNNTVITCQDPFESGFAGLLLSKCFNLALHIQIHTDLLSPYFKYSFLQKIRVFLAKIVLPNADFIRVVSKRIFDSLSKSGLKLRGVVSVLPILVDKSQFKYGGDLKKEFPDFRFHILVASRLEEEKGVKDAILAFKKVLINFPEAGLFVAGSGREELKLKSLVSMLGIYKNVVFLGWRNDLSGLIKSADLFLQTSYFEGYGMSLVEAGLLGCPVVSTDVGIAGEILKDDVNSFVCPVSDIICMQNKIEKFLRDKSLRDNFSIYLKDDVEKSLLSQDEYLKRYIGQLKNTYDKKN
jgi:glycosyltransferase involved in cell wall biosynthesis